MKKKNEIRKRRKERKGRKTEQKRMKKENKQEKKIKRKVMPHFVHFYASSVVDMCMKEY